MIADFHTHLLPASFCDRRDEIARRDVTFASLFVTGAKMANIDELIYAMDEDEVDVSVVLGYGRGHYFVVSAIGENEGFGEGRAG